LTTTGTLKVVLLRVRGGEMIGIGDNPGWFSVTVNDAPFIAVHEVGHNMGRAHVQCSAATNDEQGPDDDYPYQYPDYPARVWGGIGGDPSNAPDRFYGFDAGDVSLASPALTLPIAPLRPTGSAEPVVGDMMSYCDKRWISDYTYKALRDYLQQNFSANDPVGDFLRVVGGLGSSPDGRASFSATRLYQVPDLPLPNPGPYSIRLEGINGAVLASYPFTPVRAHDEGLLNVAEVVGFRTGTRRVVLVGPTGLELGAVQVSAAAPVVSLGPMGTALPDTGVTRIAWSATDADGDALSATIEYSADAGAHWSTLATGVRGNEYDLNNAELAGTHGTLNGRVRVLVSDGVQTGQSDSAPLTVAGKPPSLRIVTVADGAAFSVGQNVPLVAVASDLEDGSILPIEWSSDRDGALGSGSGISPVLSAGTHVISATATDSDGVRGDQVVTVFVHAAPGLGHAPVANAGPDQNAKEGDLVQLDGSRSSDADQDSLLYAWSIEEQPAVGDETGTTLSGSGPFTELRVLENGRHRFLLQVDDQRHGIASDDVTVNVQNSEPAVQVTSPADGALFKVGPVSVTAAFTDRGKFDKHACSIAWDVGGGLGDSGAISDGGANGTCTLTRSLSAGVYDTRVFVSDDDGGVGDASVQFVVYDPNGGFVTGGAQIASATGALRTAPSASGQAGLGFFAKYQKDTSTVPMGELNFELPAGNFNVHSDKYQWIAVAGSKATLRGTALVNQVTGYSFQLEIQDGQLDGSGLDRLRMKVWQTASGVIVYDNGSLANVSSGSIVLHK
jgi:hypothetical protein